MIAVVDSGVANLTSVMAALQRLGADAMVTSDAAAIAAAERVILPGVGSAGAAMARLEACGLTTVLRSLTQPVLGICLGMQLLYERSEENEGTAGLGVLAGTVRRLVASPSITVPHMGWNTLKIDAPHRLLDGIGEQSFVYFVHSYAAVIGTDTLSSAEHGRRFCAVAARGNFFGCQFHPERSGGVGARLLRNFLGF